MPEHKKHHYVPLFYLRRFSPEKGKIHIYRIDEGRIVELGNLKNQCYKNYLHGKDPGLEKLLGTLEGYAATFIDCMEKTKFDPAITQPEINYLRLFTLIQFSRTPQYARIQRSIVESLFDELAEDVRNRSSSYPSSGSIDKTTYGNNTSMHIESMMSLSPVANDLDFTLIINDTDTEFVTSDNPVVMYNQLFSSSAAGIACKGLQIFFPISPKCAVYFYDASSYNVGNNGKDSSVTVNSRDVAELNALQYCAATNNLYFTNRHFNLSSLTRKAQACREQYQAKIANYSVEKMRNDSKILLVSIAPSFQLNMKLSFSKLKKSAKTLKRKIIVGKETREFIPRDPTLMRLCNEFEELRLEGRYGILDFYKFLNETK